MNNLLKNKYFTVIIIIIIITFIVFAIALLYSNNKSNSVFKLESTNPNTNNLVPTSANKMILTFNKEIDLKSVTLSDINAEKDLVRSININNKDLVINFNALKNNYVYIITINKISSVKGEQLKDIKIQFKTKYIPYSNLTEDQKKQQLEDTDPTPTNKTILNFLPYSTDNYVIKSGKIVDSNGKSNTIVVVKNLFYMGLTPPYPDSEIKATAKTVTDFLNSTGIDRNTYVLTADNPTLAKYIDSNKIPSNSKIYLDDYGGDGIPLDK